MGSICKIVQPLGTGRRVWTAACSRVVGWRIDLVEECMTHYGGEGDAEGWRDFLEEWLPRASVCYLALCASEKCILGVLLGIWDWLEEGELYVRLLCSKCKWGGRLLERAVADAEMAPGIRRIALHSEMSCIGFYKKKGFTMIRRGWENFGRPCPLMVRPLKGLLLQGNGWQMWMVVGCVLVFFFLATLQEYTTQ